MSRFAALVVSMLLVALTALSSQAARADELPSALVLKFQPSAAALDQAAIRYAITRELDIPVVEEGSDDAAILWVELTDQGDVSLRYRPDRTQLARTMPLTGARDVPATIARLAGNIVRDQESALLAQLTPEASAPSSTTPAPQPSAISAAASESRPRDQDPAPRQGRWLTSILLGASMGPNEGALVTIAETRRLGRFDLSLAIDGGAARTDATLDAYDGTTHSDLRVTALQLTAYGAVDLRVLGNDEAQLSLGGLIGYRAAGLLSNDHLSGSNGDLALGLRVTAAFRIRGPHSVLLRAQWYLSPREHSISTSDLRLRDGTYADGTVAADALQMVGQLGYQVSYR